MQAALAPNSSIPAGAKKVVEDAEPKTLYVNRQLANASAFIAWAHKAGFQKTLPAEDLHVTVAFSKDPVDWKAPGESADAVSVAKGPRSIEKLGDKGAVVMRFESPDLTRRWYQFRGAGASWDHDGYRPHVTVTYDAGDLDLSKIEPYDGPLEFGPERFAEVDEDWADKAKASLKAADSALALDRAPRLMAIDRGSVRRADIDGRLHVAISNISMADVNPYLGDEIPDWEELGLDPKKVYQLYRDPEELARAGATSNGVPLLEEHKPMGAEDHDRDKVVGSVGTDAVFEAPFLKNSLVIWDKEAIEEVESGRKKELSCGYRYRADMTPGAIGGKRFDGVMRDIVFNHVALVEDGRAGRQVVVGDSKERLMASQKQTRIEALALRLTSAYIKPVLAADSKLDIGKLFAGLTTKNFKEKKPAIIAGLKQLKLAKDASMENVAHMLDTLEHVTEGADEAATEEEQKKAEAAAKGGDNELGIPEKAESAADAGEEGLKNFLKGKGMGEDDIKAVCDMFGKRGAKDESPEEKKAREDKDAADKKARDEAVAEEKKKGEDAMKDMVSKDEMNKAIKVAGDAATATQKAIRKAEADVRPYVGELSAMTFDSAAEVYRHTLGLLKVPNAKDLPDAALETVLKMVPKPGARAEPDDVIALDSAVIDRVGKMFPGIDKIGQA